MLFNIMVVRNKPMLKELLIDTSEVELPSGSGYGGGERPLDNNTNNSIHHQQQHLHHHQQQQLSPSEEETKNHLQQASLIHHSIYNTTNNNNTYYNYHSPLITKALYNTQFNIFLYGAIIVIHVLSCAIVMWMYSPYGWYGGTLNNSWIVQTSTLFEIMFMLSFLVGPYVMYQRLMILQSRCKCVYHTTVCVFVPTKYYFTSVNSLLCLNQFVFSCGVFI